jgi:hypothetical protein
MQTDKNIINRFTIMGERCSGTNYFENLFCENFNIELTWDYGWKHWFGFYDFKCDKLENETLFIGIIRDPIEWIDSLYKNLHHIPLVNQNIENFLFGTWYSVDDNGNEINYENSIYRDVNYNTKEKFKNIFELRKLKNDYLKNEMPKNVKNFILINYNDFMLDPINNLNTIKEKYNLLLKNDNCFNIRHYKGNNKAELFLKKNIMLEDKWINLIKENLDNNQESELGFSLNN